MLLLLSSFHAALITRHFPSKLLVLSSFHAALITRYFPFMLVVLSSFHAALITRHFHLYANCLAALIIIRSFFHFCSNSHVYADAIMLYLIPNPPPFCSNLHYPPPLLDLIFDVQGAVLSRHATDVSHFSNFHVTFLVLLIAFQCVLHVIIFYLFCVLLFQCAIFL
jgi:hypothetical protein